MAFKFNEYHLGGTGGSGTGGGDNTVIDVTELPTENVDETKIYRVSERTETDIWLAYLEGDTPVKTPFSKMYAKYGIVFNVPVYEVDTLPDVMEPTDQATMTYPCYVIKSTGIAYCSVDGTSATAASIGTGFSGSDGGYVGSPEEIIPSTTMTFYTIKGASLTHYGIVNDGSKSVWERNSENEWVNITQENKSLKQELVTAYAGNLHISVIRGSESTDSSVSNNFADAIFTSRVSLKADINMVSIPDFVQGIGVRTFIWTNDISGDYECYERMEILNLPKSVVCFDTEAFDYCGGTNGILSTINYAGTKADWGAIHKAYRWRGQSGRDITNFTVHCEDGDIIYVDGTET